MAWGIVEPLLLRKEMAVSDGWDGRSSDFPGGLLMSPPSYTGLRRLWLHLLLVLLDGGAVAELVIFWATWAVGWRLGVWIGMGEDTVLSLFIRLMIAWLLLVLEDTMGCSSSLSMLLLAMLGGLAPLKVWRRCDGAIDGAAECRIVNQRLLIMDRNTVPVLFHM